MNLESSSDGNGSLCKSNTAVDPRPARWPSSTCEERCDRGSSARVPKVRRPLTGRFLAMIRLRKLLAVLAVTLTAGATTGAIGAVAVPVATPASASQPLTTPTQVGGSVLEEGFSVMATDGVGDVFGNDSTVGSGSVSWLAHSSSGYAPQLDLYLTNPPNVSGAMYVEGLATDSNNDIFASVYNPGVSSSVVELTRSGSGYSTRRRSRSEALRRMPPQVSPWTRPATSSWTTTERSTS